MSREVVIRFDSMSALQEQRAHLEAGGAFAPGATDLAEDSLCIAILVHPTTRAELRLKAQVVWSSEVGAGLAFTGFDSEASARIEGFISGAKPAEEVLDLSAAGKRSRQASRLVRVR